MDRRALLTSLGCLALAGCTAGDEPAGTGTEAAETASSTTAEATAELTSEKRTTADPETPDVGVPPGEADGPPWRDGTDRAVSWTQATESPLRLTPPTQVGSLPEASFDFTLENRTSVRFETNPYDWGLWRRFDGEWFFVTPRYVPEPLMYVEPGETHKWTLEATGTVPETDVERVEGSSSLRVNALGGGTYAFTVEGNFPTEGYPDVGLAARFELDGDPLELTPSSAVTETAREGDTVVVSADFETDSTLKGDAVVVERVGDKATDAKDEVRRVIPERAVRDQRLRNTLPFFEAGVTTVRLEPTASSWPVFGVRDGVVEYEGTRYRVTEKRGETQREETSE